LWERKKTTCTCGYVGSRAKIERERLYAAVYETDHWKTSIDPMVAEFLDRDKTVVTRIEPTPKSVIH
jgi:hypothetical protein